ncbi:MAG: RsmE family RNA methyltransferase, partial [bacterium]
MTAPPQPPLFHHPDLPAPGQRIVVGGDEAIHIARARRLGAGERVCLTDGDGRLAQCRVVSLAARPVAVELEIESVRTVARPAVEIALAAALPKGEAQAIMLDMAAQLGMARFIPLRCARSVVRFQPRMRARWRRIVRSACKQCRQCHFPRIDAEADLGALLAAERAATWLVGDRAGRSLSRLDRGILRGAQVADGDARH